MTINIVLCDFKVNTGTVADWPVDRYRNAPYRVIFDDEAKAKPVLRALMAHDLEVELLDVDRIRYGWLAYDTAQIRRALTGAKLQPMEPWVLWTTQRWALERIGELTQGNEYHESRSLERMTTERPNVQCLAEAAPIASEYVSLVCLRGRCRNRTRPTWVAKCSAAGSKQAAVEEEGAACSPSGQTQALVARRLASPAGCR